VKRAGSLGVERPLHARGDGRRADDPDLQVVERRRVERLHEQRREREQDDGGAG
jgi:hypothetical protein